MSFCPSCGARLGVDARFCARCGAGTAAPAAPARSSVRLSPLPEARPRPDNSVAWLLAAAPLLSLCLDVALVLGGNVQAAVYSTLIAVALTAVLAVVDSHNVQRHGYSVSTALALFVAPAYLNQRARATQQGRAIPAAWLVAFIVSLAVGTALLRGYGTVDLDMPKVEASIKTQVDSALDTDSTVKCPTVTAYQVHDSFLCVVADLDRVFHEQVTVQNDAGDVVWQPTG